MPDLVWWRDATLAQIADLMVKTEKNDRLWSEIDVALLHLSKKDMQTVSRLVRQFSSPRRRRSRE